MLHTVHFFGNIHKESGRMLHRKLDAGAFESEGMEKILSTPKSLPEFQQIFPSEAACSAYLYSVRFPGGFHVPTAAGQEMHSASKDGQICCDVGAVGETLD
jgi:hypothetical protein